MLGMKKRDIVSQVRVQVFCFRSTHQLAELVIYSTLGDLVEELRALTRRRQRQLSELLIVRLHNLINQTIGQRFLSRHKVIPERNIRIMLMIEGRIVILMSDVSILD